MSDSVSGGMGDSIGGAAQRIAGGMHNAAEQAGHVACRAHNGVGEVRGSSARSRSRPPWWCSRWAICSAGLVR